MAPGLVTMELAAIVILLALGTRTVEAQACANRAETTVIIPEPPDGIQNVESNPIYRGQIINGTLPGTTLVFDPSGSTSSTNVRIEARDSNGAFYLQMIQAVDRDGPTPSIVDDVNQIQFIMKCLEGGGDYFFPLRLLIDDINDNSPQFVGLPYAVSVNELTPVGSSVFIQISATDRDNGPNKEIEYAIVPGGGTVTDGSAKFEILQRTRGFVTVKDVLDFESLNAIGQPSYILNISATDYAQPEANRRRTFTTLNVTILDGDDLGPEFVYTSCFKYRSVCLNPEYTASVISGTTGTGRLTMNSVPPDGSGSVLIRAKDQDTLNYPLTFAIETTVPDGYRDFFSVNTVGPNGGLYEAQITQVRSIDRATVPNLRIILRATETSTNSRFNRATIYLTVNAANANEPQLSTSTGDQTGYILENSPVDTYIKDQPLRNNFRILVTDRDVSPSDPAPTYEFETIPNTAFRVDGDGYVRLVVQPLNYETNARYIFSVVVRESYTPERRSATNSLTVIVVDVNDNAPIFATRNYEISVPEGDYSLSRGGPRLLLQVQATDADQGVNGQITYSLINTSPLSPDKFVVNSNGSSQLQGAVRVGERYVLQIRASDGGSPSLSDTAVVVVTVTAGNRGPDIPFNETAIYVSEGILLNSYIWTLPVTDPDGDALTFNITAGNTGNTFFISSGNGTITNRALLDRETTPSFTLNLLVTDPNQLSDSARLNIIVTDVNDNTPVFPLGANYVFSVQEGQQPPVSVGTVAATDADESNTANSLIRYSIVQDPDAYFQIDPNTGSITTRRPLDYETRGQHLIVVQAIDSAAASRTGTVLVTVNVIDIDDQVPLFQPTTYETSVGEDAVIGTSVIRVTAVDRDAAPNVVYELSGAEATAFTINGQTGEIRTQVALDYETKTRYVIQVTTAGGRNSGQIATTATVTINVLDRNDFAPVINGLVNRNVQKLENAPIGDLIEKLTATDGDTPNTLSSTIQFRIVSVTPVSGQSLFYLNPESGDLVLSGRLTSVPSPNVFTIVVVARDQGNPQQSSSPVNIVVTVIRNTQAPRFDQSNFITSPVRMDAPQGTLVHQITAIDDDIVRPFNERTYAIIGDGNAQDYFQIDGSTGTITVRDLLARDTGLVYRLRIVATDGGGLSATATATVSVERNLYRPEVLQQNYTENILENQALSTPIVTVTATDRDLLSPYRDLQFRIVGNPQAQRYFSINNNGQIVLIRSPADDPTISTFYLEVEVSDQGLPNALTADRRAFVTVNVLRNANSPIFFSSTYEITIEESLAISSSIIRVSASDADITAPFNTLEYRATGDGSAPFYFRVSSSTGEVFLNNTLRGVPIDRFTLRIEVQDRGSPPRFASAIVYINVRRNFFPPQFTAPSYSATILETRPVLDTILTVAATDSDGTPPHNSVYYQLTGDVDGLFYFQVSESGAVSVRRPLTSDALRRNSYSLTVKALDRGTPQLTSAVEVPVTINVQRNNNPPRFVNEPYTRTIMPQGTSGTVVTVLAVDLDPPGTFNTVKYSIDGPEGAQNLWSIDENTGTITARSPATINNGIESPYYITVKAVDNGVPPLSDSTVVTLTINRNQFAPSFAQTQYTVNISETQSVGTVYFRVTATDQDTVSPNNDLVYEAVILSSLFSVNTLNNRVGQLSVSGNLLLDRNTNQYTMLVAAIDKGAFPLRSTNTATVTINVLRNSFSPEFVQTPYNTRILRTANIGSAVFSVTAVDRDTQSPYNVVTYQIVGSTAPGRFTINQNTGLILLAQSIANEADSEYIISVSASDGGSPSRVVYETVRVTVDRNLFDPEWTNPGSSQGFTSSTSVQETIDFAFLISSVTATDRDQSSPHNTLTYSIVGEGSAPTYFNINPDNGEIRLKSSLLQDTQESYRILVKVMDRGSPPRSATATVTINVGVVRNKVGPVFINTPYSSMQNENIGLGTLITTVTARDNDPTPFNQVTYDIIGDDEAPVYFTVDRNTGAITLLRSLAGETKSTYSVRVRACDSGNPPKCNSTAVIMTINRNLFTPECTQTQYDVTIAETQNLRVPIVTLRARDQDTAETTKYAILQETAQCKISSGPADYFAIDSNTGVISVRKSLARTNITLFKLTVQATGGGDNQTQRHTVVYVNIFGESVEYPEVAEARPVAAADGSTNRARRMRGRENGRESAYTSDSGGDSRCAD